MYRQTLAIPVRSPPNASVTRSAATAEDWSTRSTVMSDNFCIRVAGRLAMRAGTGRALGQVNPVAYTHD